MSSVTVTKTPNKYVTVTKTNNVSVVTQPETETLEVHDPGPAGPANNLSIGTVVPTTSGVPAVTITGSAPSQTLNFVLPVGGVYTHNQMVSASTWTITHNLGFFPSVTVIDSGNNTVIGNVTYISENQLSVSFNATFGGKAYLS
jgi:hypothetical protein